ncbi:MAG: hypothetical protein K1060chlam5_00988 [Candidatus Anoxychlamydiales bacterium]|nr:hypothetical protein [Candidatus Anoxychlamydiales bacterium]
MDITRNWGYINSIRILGRKVISGGLARVGAVTLSSFVMNLDKIFSDK